MGEFYRLREPQLTLMPVDLNKLVGQVIDLTRARWSDMAQRRGAAIDMRPELDRTLPLVSAVEATSRRARQSGFQCRRRHARGRAADHSARASPREAGSRSCCSRCRMRGGHGRRHPPPLSRAVLHHEGHSRYRPGAGDGLRRLPSDTAPASKSRASLAKARWCGMSFAIAPVATEVSSGLQRQPAGPMRILVVDDDPLLLKSLRDTLEVDRHEVTTANSGKAGIDAFRAAFARPKTHPFAVYPDLGMPHIDGRKVAATIKSSVPATLVLMLTGWAGVSSSRAMCAGRRPGAQQTSEVARVTCGAREGGAGHQKS